MSKSESFKRVLGTLKNAKSATIRVACTSEQRTLVEKYLVKVTGFPFVDKRKYATTYFLPSGSKIILLHEKLLGPLFKSKVEFDIRQWPVKRIEEFFKL